MSNHKRLLGCCANSAEIIPSSEWTIPDLGNASGGELFVYYPLTKGGFFYGRVKTTIFSNKTKND